MKIKIETQPCGLTDFYEKAAKKYISELSEGRIDAVDFSEYKFDCRKIDVSQNIQDMFYEYYTKLVKENDSTISDPDIKTGITMLLAMSGPKVNTNLADNEIEIFDGFIC
jgi:hypothetical protein